MHWPEKPHVDEPLSLEQASPHEPVDASHWQSGSEAHAVWRLAKLSLQLDVHEPLARRHAEYCEHEAADLDAQSSTQLPYWLTLQLELVLQSARLPHDASHFCDVPSNWQSGLRVHGDAVDVTIWLHLV